MFLAVLKCGQASALHRNVCEFTFPQNTKTANRGEQWRNPQQLTKLRNRVRFAKIFGARRKNDRAVGNGRTSRKE